MRIERVIIEEYLGLRNIDYEFASPDGNGLVLVEGPNEAGKSTLLRFIQALLFGKDTLRGAVVLREGDDRYRIEQNGTRPTLRVRDLGTGEACSKGQLEALLGNLDAKVYRNIFAFGLSELQALESLTGDGVQERIFSASVAGAGRSARAALKQFDGELSELLKPRAKSHISNLAKDLKDAQKAAKEAHAANQAYAQVQLQERELTEQIQTSTKEQSDRKSELERLQAVLTIWPDWDKGEEAREELANADAISGLPPEAPVQLEQTRALAENFERERQNRLKSIEELRLKIAVTPTDTQLVELGLEIDRVVEGVPVQVQRLDEDLPRIEKEAQLEQEALNESLSSLGEGWTAERLAHADADTLVPEQVVLDTRWLDSADEIERLEHGLPAQELRLEQCTSQARKTEELGGRVVRLLERLGPTWTEERVREFDDSQIWRQHADAVRSEVESYAGHQTQARALLDGARQRLGVAQDALRERPKPEQAKDDLERTHVQLVDRAADLAALASQIEERSQRIQELQNAKAAVAVSTSSPRSAQPWLALILGSAGPAAAAAIAYSTLPWLAYAFGALALASLLLLWPRDRTAPGTSVGGGPQVDLASAEAGLSRLQEEIRTKLTGLELAQDAGVAAVHKERVKVESQREDYKQLLDAWVAYDAALRLVAGVQYDLENAEADVQSHLNKQGELIQGWQEWCAKHGVPVSTRPESMDAYLDLLRSAQEGITELHQSRKANDELDRKVAAYHRDVAAVGARLGETGVDDDPKGCVQAWSRSVNEQQELQTQIAEWRADLRQAKQQLRRARDVEQKVDALQRRIAAWESEARELLEDAQRDTQATGKALVEAVQELGADLTASRAEATKIEGWEEAQETLTGEAADYEARHREQNARADELLRQTGASDDADLKARIAEQARQKDLAETIRSLNATLRAHFGTRVEEARQILEQRDPLKWEEDVRTLKHDVERLQTELDHEETGMQAQRASIREQKKQLEASSAVAERLAAVESLRHQLQAAVRRWVVRRLSADLISNTLQEYERTRVPDVLRYASESFSGVTEGRYVRLQNGEAGEIRVFTQDERVLDARQLSRGAQEQLYLAVRLGLVDSFAEQNRSLPLVMDDVLVNSDPERAERLADALARSAEQHQLIFLTCHPHTAALLRDRLPDCVHVQLPRIDAAGVDVARPSFASQDMPELLAGDDLHQKVLTVLAGSSNGLGRSEICDRADVPYQQFPRLINELIADGHVTKRGEKRGTLYSAVQA